MPKEIEIKFRISRMNDLARRLRAEGFKRVTPRTREVNILYDRPGQALRKRGELLRLRKYGSDWLLTHKAKGQVGLHKIRVETQTGIEDGEKLKQILLALGFTPSFRYEKFRQEWSDGQGHVVLDETPIGCFGEIEGPARWIDRTARRLQLAREAYITDSYAELFLAWKRRTHNPATEMTFRAVPNSKAPE